MTLTGAPTQSAQASAALSRTPREGLRRARGWLVLVAVLVIGSCVALAVQVSLAGTSADPMGASNPGPQGGQALARVLAEHGVDVRTAGSLSEAREAASARSDTTVLLSDPNGLLDASQLATVRSLGSEVVAIDPGFDALQTLTPSVRPAGTPAVTHASAHCGLAAAQAAGTVSGIRTAYRVTGDAGGCFPTGSAYALARATTDGTHVAVVGPALFDNGHIERSGNAALAIGLLGSHRTLVWYLPGEADVVGSGPPTLAEITPGWLTPVILLLIGVVVAAAVWRGRRFGPLVIEDLPVEVPAAETMLGRGRLYRAASDRLHALDALRIGALHRIGALCGLPPNAHVDQVIASAAGLSGWPAVEVRDLLLQTTPATDAAMLAAASRLTELEEAVRLAIAGGSASRSHPDPDSRADLPATDHRDTGADRA